MRFMPGLMVLLALPSSSAAAEPTSILDTKHNLSVSGRGEIRSVSETRVCIFCHSSHNTSPEGPLWNHQTSRSGQFRTYARSSLEGSPEQPNGATKLCLSCHDGTVAVGALHGGTTIPMRGVGGGGEIPAGRRSRIGTDLSGTHPVSIPYGQQQALARRDLRWPPLDAAKEVGADADGYVQCTSCHDPHGSRSRKYPMWRKETFSQVCKVCHDY